MKEYVQSVLYTFMKMALCDPEQWGREIIIKKFVCVLKLRGKV